MIADLQIANRLSFTISKSDQLMFFATQQRDLRTVPVIYRVFVLHMRETQRVAIGPGVLMEPMMRDCAGERIDFLALVPEPAGIDDLRRRATKDDCIEPGYFGDVAKRLEKQPVSVMRRNHRAAGEVKMVRAIYRDATTRPRGNAVGGLDVAKFRRAARRHFLKHSFARQCKHIIVSYPFQRPFRAIIFPI
jgi:hypothetical protein